MKFNFQNKILPWADVATWRRRHRSQGKRLVVTHGCFDILHLGHVTYLEQARNEGDALMVGVNSDAGVRELKGPTRPVNNEADRAGILAALESVDYVCIFPGKRAVQFLQAALPDIYVKGGDYTMETLNQEERGVVETNGARIVFIPFLKGRSTTETLSQIERL